MLKLACQYLPLAIYCNLDKYGLPITTILDVFRSVLDSSNRESELFDRNYGIRTPGEGNLYQITMNGCLYLSYFPDAFFSLASFTS
jgi:hypothetical protein